MMDMLIHFFAISRGLNGDKNAKRRLAHIMECKRLG